MVESNLDEVLRFDPDEVMHEVMREFFPDDLPLCERGPNRCRLCKRFGKRRHPKDWATVDAIYTTNYKQFCEQLSFKKWQYYMQFRQFWLRIVPDDDNTKPGEEEYDPTEDDSRVCLLSDCEDSDCDTHRSQQQRRRVLAEFPRKGPPPKSQHRL